MKYDIEYHQQPKCYVCNLPSGKSGDGMSFSINFNVADLTADLTRKAQAGVKVDKSWGLLNQIISMGKQTIKDNET